MTLLELIAYCEDYNKRHGNAITDIHYDLHSGMATISFYVNVFSITFHKYETKNYTKDYVESIFNDILEKVTRGELRKEEFYGIVD